MIDHVDIRVSDRAASERFYTIVLSAIGKEQTHSDDEYAEWDQFGVISDGLPVAKNLHVAFWVPATELVDAFHAAGVAAGFRDDGRPGPRPQYGPDYYGGFLRDPDGHSVEAVTNAKTDRKLGEIDHLWLRSPDINAAKAFYETIAPFAGLRLGDDEPDRKQFVTRGASVSFVTGEPRTENVHIAFAAETNEQVDAFHAAAVAAGYTDNGAPGERAVYHPGYYGAFVLDPDGHNVEAVNHNR